MAKSILALDKNFEPIAYLEGFAYLFWHERYFGCGEFVLKTADVIPDVCYIYRSDEKETGVVEGIDYTDEGTEYTGRFLKSLLSNRVVNSTSDYYNQTAEQIVKSLVSRFAGQGIEVEPNLGLGTQTNAHVFGENLMEYCDKLLETQDLGCYVEYDYKNDKKIFRVFKGEDNTLNKVPLSKSFENIYKYHYIKSDKEYKNYAFVSGTYEWEEEVEILVGEESTETVTIQRSRPITTTVDYRKEPLEDKREIFVDSSVSSRLESGRFMSEYEFRRALAQEGKNKLSEYQIQETVNMDVEVINEPEYFYEIGEKRLFKSLIATSEQRITEIITTISENSVSKTIVFGLQRITEAGKVKREVGR